MSNLLLIIDPQNDFCNIGDENGQGRGTLYVPGAYDDMIRLSQWIIKNKKKIDHIIITLDNHHLMDISHTVFWIDDQGRYPQPFSTIKVDDVKQGRWRSVIDNDKALEYLQKLESQGITHTVWPTHCLIGSEGAAIFSPLLDAINSWAEQGFYYQPIIKGTYPFTEHFGAFAAQVIYDDVPETQINTELLDLLGKFDNIIIAGEARSHCVGTSLKQLIEYVPSIVEKITILEDAMSNVPGFKMEDVYLQAKNMGAKSMTTKMVKL